MFKLVIAFALLVAAVSAGGLVGHAYPLAPVLHTPVATSYANTYKVSVKAPLVHAAPALHYAAAPALHYAAAPSLHYAAAPSLHYAAAPSLHYAAAPALAYPYAYGKAYGYGFHY